MRLSATKLSAIGYSSGFGDSLYNAAGQVPSLDLNFATRKSLTDSVTGASLVTFTRSSNGTYTDSAGVLQTAGTDVPRFDHNPTTGESLGLLVEEQKTNLLLRSEEFDNGEWAAVRASISANATVAPNGTSTGDKLIEDTTASNNHFVRPATSSNVTSGTAYTFTVFAKAAGRTQLTIGFGTENSAFADSSGLFTLTDAGAAATGGAATSTSIQSVGNGWYRCRVSATATATAFAFIRLLLTSSGNSAYTGDGTSGIFLWGAQLEAGAFPTSYIPTTAAGVTRNADVASITGSAFSELASGLNWTFFIEGARIPSITTSSTMGGLSGGNTQNRLQVRQDNSTTAVAISVTSNVLDAAVSLSLNASRLFNRVAVAQQLNRLTAAADGSLGTSDTTVLLPPVTQLDIGSTAGTSIYNGTIRRICYWPTLLANSTLQQITQ